MLCIPFLDWWQGSRSKNWLEGAMKEMPTRGHNLRLLDEAREPGREQYRGPETQAGQHMPNQPRGQKNSRRLWRSRRRKSSSVPEGRADSPAAIFVAGKCPNPGRDSISCCRRIGESFSSSGEICRKTFPARNFGQSQPSRVF